jgi:hypothetical protein
VLALQDLVDQDLFICPRCASPVRPESGKWHCAGASCRYADQAFPCFFWLSYLDRFLDPKHSVDAASSVFFLGRKTDRQITRADIIDYYQGGM